MQHLANQFFCHLSCKSMQSGIHASLLVLALFPKLAPVFFNLDTRNLPSSLIKDSDSLFGSAASFFRRRITLTTSSPDIYLQCLIYGISIVEVN